MYFCCKHKGARLPVLLAKRFMGQITGAVGYCHYINIVHRDLKPENILVNCEDDNNLQVKIVDFGLSVAVRKGTLLDASCGSMPFASPQIIMGVPYDGFASDIWAAGVVLSEMMCGINMFTHLFKWEGVPKVDDCRTKVTQICDFFVVDNKKAARNTIMTDFLAEYSKENLEEANLLLDLLLDKMLVLVPDDRCKIRDVAGSPWLNAFVVRRDAETRENDKKRAQNALSFDYRGTGTRIPTRLEALRSRKRGRPTMT